MRSADPAYYYDTFRIYEDLYSRYRWPAEYPAYLRQVRLQAEQMQDAAVFSRQNSDAQRSARKAAEDFSRCEQVVLRVADNRFITAVNRWRGADVLAGAETSLYVFLHPASAQNGLKYVNLLFLLDPAAVLTGYVNLNCFGRAVGVRPVLYTACGAAGLVLSVCFLRQYSRAAGAAPSLRHAPPPCRGTNRRPAQPGQCLPAPKRRHSQPCAAVPGTAPSPADRRAAPPASRRETVGRAASSKTGRRSEKRKIRPERRLRAAPGGFCVWCRCLR